MTDTSYIDGTELFKLVGGGGQFLRTIIKKKNLGGVGWGDFMRNQLSCKNHFNHHLTIWRELFAISKDLRYLGQIINKCFISKIEITSIELNNILIVTIWHTKI